MPWVFACASQSAAACMTEVPGRQHHCESGGAGKHPRRALCQARTHTEATLRGRASSPSPLGVPTVRQAQMYWLTSPGMSLPRRVVSHQMS